MLFGNLVFCALSYRRLQISSGQFEPAWDGTDPSCLIRPNTLHLGDSMNSFHEMFFNGGVRQCSFTIIPFALHLMTTEYSERLLIVGTLPNSTEDILSYIVVSELAITYLRLSSGVLSFIIRLTSP